jgi:hypothetical protein
LSNWVRALPRLWREPAPEPRPAPDSLDLPLRPSPLGRRAARLFLATQLLFVFELALFGHWWLALAALALAARFAWLWVRSGRSAPGSPRRLLLAADGRCHLLTVSGTVEELALHPASLRLGRWLLLLFRSGGRTHRFLLGPDNLAPAELAALQRRIGSTQGRPDMAMHGGR